MSATRQRLSPEARKAQLIEIAMKVFATDGLERAGHGDIAKLAGVSTATVFNYFPTREDLLESVLEELRAKIRGLFAALGDGKTQTGNGLRMMVTAFDHLIKNDPDMVKVFMRWETAFGHDIRKSYLKFQEEILDGIQSRLLNSRPDRSDARIIIGGAYVYSQMRLDGTAEDVIERFVERLLSVLGE